MSEEKRLAAALAAKIASEADAIGRTVRIMEVCGTHTVELRRQGIRSLLPPAVGLVSGPGCPVCVTPTGYIDNAISLVESGDALVASFGDMLRVPGSSGATLSSFGGTGRVRLVYSPSELPAMARASDRPVVFLAVGFETTIPTILSAILDARDAGIGNLFLSTAFKRIAPAIRHLLGDPRLAIDGFLLPGHVSVIVGPEEFAFLEGPGGKPGVITGFEALDMLLGILQVLRQVRAGESRVENAYPRAVRPGGNARARELIARCLTPSNDVWRGLGRISGGSLDLAPAMAGFDARARFPLRETEDSLAPGCRCAAVIAGAASPSECGLFGGRCTPEDPVGPCMVSSEGACAAHFRYGRIP